MHLPSIVFAGLLLSMSAGTASAQDCNDRCCQFGICEPVCKSSCEAEKAARGVGVPVPDIGPSKGWELGEKLLTMSCAAGFETVMKPAILNTGFQAAGGDRYINTYAQILVNAGIISAEEFNGVSIRWCRLYGAEGLVPDSDLVCLSDALNRNDWYYISLLLAHEMTHVRQYRRMGTDNFKCQYVKDYVNCKGCQDERHPLESEALRYQAASKNILENYLRNGGWHP